MTRIVFSLRGVRETGLLKMTYRIFNKSYSSVIPIITRFGCTHSPGLGQRAALIICYFYQSAPAEETSLSGPDTELSTGDTNY